jgi:hypothetical protein
MLVLVGIAAALYGLAFLIYSFIAEVFPAGLPSRVPNLMERRLKPFRAARGAAASRNVITALSTARIMVLRRVNGIFTVLGESGGLPDTPAGWRRYADYLRVMAEEDTKLREERFGRLSRGWAIGSAEFKADLRKEFAARAVGSGGLELRGADGEAHREMRALLWEDRRGQLAKRLQVALDRLPARKSAEPKVRLAAAMKAVSSVSNVWLAERLTMGRPASGSR